MRFLKILCLIVSSSFLLIACGAGGGGGGGNGGGNGGSGGAIYKIAEYFFLGQGDTWTYKVQGGGTDIYTIKGTETINGVVAVKKLEDDGDYQLFTNTDGVKRYKGYDVEPGEWAQTVFTPPITYCPAEVSVGTKYTSSSSVDYSDSIGNNATGTISTEVTIEGVEDIAVIAGTFKDCLKIKLTHIINIGGTTISSNETTWSAKDVGDVKSIGASFENGAPLDTWNNELVSATVGGISYQ